MKILTLAAALLLPLTAGCVKKADTYELSFLQGGETVKQDGDRVMLKKAPFTVLVRMNNPMGVMLNFQERDKIYRAANSGRELYEPGYAMAEYTFNPEKNFLLTPDTYHYWYYTDSKDHRFDSVERKGGWYECSRGIENYGRQGDAKNYPIASLPHGRVYLTAFNTVKAGDAWKSANIKTFRLVFY